MLDLFGCEHCVIPSELVRHVLSIQKSQELAAIGNSICIAAAMQDKSFATSVGTVQLLYPTSCITELTLNLSSAVARPFAKSI